TGAGARRARDERLARLASRVSADEREFLARIIGGEMRTGVSEGLLLEAIAAAWGVDVAAARRAALFLGDLTAVATLAAAGGAAVALDAAGRPLPFQELMRRFRRVHGIEALVREMPLALHFFDCLMAGGRSLIDAPYERRWEALTAVTGGRYLAERRIVTAEPEALAFRDAALAAGHEGVMAKELASTYEPGGRGKRWF